MCLGVYVDKKLLYIERNTFELSSRHKKAKDFTLQFSEEKDSPIGFEMFSILIIFVRKVCFGIHLVRN